MECGGLVYPDAGRAAAFTECAHLQKRCDETETHPLRTHDAITKR